MAERAEIELELDTTKFEAALQREIGLSGDAAAKMGAAMRSRMQAEKSFDSLRNVIAGMPGETQRSANKMARALQKELATVDESTGGVARSMSSLGRAVGLPVERVENLSKGISGLVSAVGPAGVMLGAAGAAVAGVGLAAYGAVLGVQALHGAMVSEVQAAIKLGDANGAASQALQDAALALSVQTRESERAAAAMGESLAPAVEATAYAQAALSNTWANAKKELGNLAAEAFNAGAVYVEHERRLASVNADYADMLKNIVPLPKGIWDVADALAAQAVAMAGDSKEYRAYKQELSATQSEIETETANLKRNRELRERIHALAQATKQDLKEEAAARAASTDQIGRENAFREVQIGFEEENAELEQERRNTIDSGRQLQERIDAEQKAKADAAEAEIKAAKDLIRTKQALQDDALSVTRSYLGAGLELAQQAGLDSFAVSKASAIADILVNSNKAAMAWAPVMGPIVAPAAAAALAALEIAAVAATPPPAYHGGGIVGPASDERDLRIRVLEGEGVRVENRREAREGAAPQTIRVVNMYEHRAYSSFIADNLQTDGALARTIRTSRRGPVGHRTRSR